MMQKKILTEAEWVKLMLDMPLHAPSCSTTEKAEKTVGCCVKTRAVGPDRFAEDFGRILKYSPERVVVLCFKDREFMHKDKSLCVWDGTVEDFHAVWKAD